MKQKKMNFKTMDKHEIAQFLCEIVEDTVTAVSNNLPICDYCPAQNDCFLQHTGFLDWIADDEENV